MSQTVAQISPAAEREARLARMGWPSKRPMAIVRSEPAAPEPYPEIRATLNAMERVLAGAPRTPGAERIARQVALVLMDHFADRDPAAQALGTIPEAIDEARLIVAPVIARSALRLTPTYACFYQIFTEIHRDAPCWTIGDLARVVSEASGVSVLDMRSERRDRRIVRARQLGMWLAKRFTPRSTPSIGRHYGGRDHTTVLHGCAVIERIVDEHCIDAGGDPQEWSRLVIGAIAGKQAGEAA